MKTPLKSFALLSGALALFASSTFAVSTDPVGYVTIALEGDSKYNFISLPLVAASNYQGVLSSSSATTLSVSGTPWGANDYAGTHYVEITSTGSGQTGLGEGLIVDIVSNTQNVLTLADNISSYALEGDETFRVVEHFTLESVFGVNNSSGLLGGSSGGSSDEVMLWNPSIQQFVAYFYNTALSRWAPSLNPFGANANSEILYPDQGVVVFRRGSGQKDIVLAGMVKTGKSQGAVFPGFNFYDNQKPIDLTLGTSGWESDLMGGTSAGASDEVGLWNAASQTLTLYFYNTALSRWAPSLNPFGADASSTPIGSTDAVLVNRKSSAVVVTEDALVLN